MEFLNCVISQYSGKVLNVAVDGSYPLDSNKSLWQLVVTITRDAGLELLGMPKGKCDHNTLTNKCFCVFGYDGDLVFAVYTHDGKWYIIRAKAAEFEALVYAQKGVSPESRGLRKEASVCNNKCCVSYETPALIEGQS